MNRRFTGEYPRDWPDIAKRVKEQAGNLCVRCGSPSDLARGRVLTTHHLDNDKSNVAWWNLLSLCQKCHLRIQGKVILGRPWVWEHTPWFRPYVAGYYAHHYLGVELTRQEVLSRLDELLALEARAVIGQDPIPLGVAR